MDVWFGWTSMRSSVKPLVILTAIHTGVGLVVALCGVAVLASAVDYGRATRQAWREP